MIVRNIFDSSNFRGNVNQKSDLPAPQKPIAKKQTGGAVAVALGIFLSRLAGLIRERVFAHYFGNSAAGDAFKAALRIPNFLQNLFGEGVLSASFIPIYANLLAKKSHEDADKVAGAVASLLAVVVSVFVLVGVLFTSAFIDVVAPGFTGDKRDLTINIVQILFPGVGLLVMSAWCLGILNSHRKFFLSYFAPVLWNLAIIATLVIFGRRQDQSHLAITTAWGLVIGSALQFFIQIPLVFRLIGKLSPNLDVKFEPVRRVLRSFFPVLISRGVVQISAYIDSIYASWLPTGAVAAIAYAQTIYLLPVSLFGMSVSAAELPEMSSMEGTNEEVAAKLTDRISRAMLQVSFFVVPTLCVFVGLGDLVVGALYQSGQFDAQATKLVWYILAGSSFALMPATQGRIFSSAFYALRDADTPLKFALIRVALTCLYGYFAAFKVPGWLGLEPMWGAVFLAASSGGWIEYTLLKRALKKKFGANPDVKLLTKIQIWGSSILAVAIGYGLKMLLPQMHVILKAVCVLGTVGIIYISLGAMFGLPPALRVVKKLNRR